MQESPQRVLIIAGSDPSGGAGLQADLKAVTCLGGYAMTAVTALTVQNTLGVTEILAIPTAFIRAQAEACLSDIGADAIKTGMLGNADVMQAVAAILDSTDAFKVIDPVMVAKGGHPLLAEDAMDALRTLLIPRADLLTPNAPEAAALTGLEFKTPEDMPKIAEALKAMGAKSMLLKGAHLDGDRITDGLFTPEGVHYYTSERIPSRHTHGTGCTLASSIAALNIPERPVSKTVALARDYVREAIIFAPNLGQGHGPLRHNFQVRA